MAGLVSYTLFVHLVPSWGRILPWIGKGTYGRTGDLNHSGGAPFSAWDSRVKVPACVLHSASTQSHKSVRPSHPSHPHRLSRILPLRGVSCWNMHIRKALGLEFVGVGGLALPRRGGGVVWVEAWSETWVSLRYKLRCSVR